MSTSNTPSFSSTHVQEPASQWYPDAHPITSYKRIACSALFCRFSTHRLSLTPNKRLDRLEGDAVSEKRRKEEKKALLGGASYFLPPFYVHQKPRPKASTPNEQHDRKVDKCALMAIPRVRCLMTAPEEQCTIHRPLPPLEL